MDDQAQKLKLSPVSFGVALGLTFGFILLALALLGVYYDSGITLIKTLESLFAGYGATWQGGFMGLAWGFIMGMIIGLPVCWIYNSINALIF